MYIRVLYRLWVHVHVYVMYMYMYMYMFMYMYMYMYMYMICICICIKFKVARPSVYLNASSFMIWTSVWINKMST